MEPLQVIIVDDQVLFRENLKIVIELIIPGAKVVGQAGNGLEALELCRTTPHNLILLDVRMPEMDGVEFIRCFRSEGQNSRIIVLTTFEDDEYVFEALKFGAAGYLLKEIQPEDLAKAIINVHNGGTLVSPQITAKLVKEVNRYRAVDNIAPNEILSQLTAREVEVLRHLAMGEDNQQIANNLQLAEGTVKNYISNIYEKLELKDRVQATRFAILRGLV
ncbi:MAG TPA: response regulator transcription factor [Bacillota bacterium]|nr:response regulator transcription factor [Bacillota bacterium]